MNSENLTTLTPQDFGSRVDPDRPVLSLHYYADRPHRVAGHEHPRAQILYPSDGVYRVNTSDGNWIVPPSQAIWIPSNVYHEIYANYSVTSRIFFIDEAHTDGLPKNCTVISISSLLDELLRRAIDLGNEYQMGDRKSRFFQVLLDELREMTPAPLGLPLAQDKRVRSVMNKLIMNPVLEKKLEELAVEAGASSRNLERLFIQSTGMSFSEWRNTLLLQEAIEMLTQGKSVTGVALDLGYNSPSAFIAMFKKKFGVSPGNYISRN